MTYHLQALVRDPAVFAALPVGAEIGGQYKVYRKVTDTEWADEHGGRVHSNSLHRNYYFLTGMPNRVENLDQYKQRFSTIVIGGAQRSGIDQTIVTNVLSKLEVPTYDPAESMIVDPYDSRLSSRLPAKTLLVVGDPAHTPQFGLFTVGDGPAWQAVMGGVKMPDYSGGEVVGLPPSYVGDMTWAQREATEEDARRIAAFKARAWQVGWVQKRNSSWCSEYENVMCRAGITEAALAGLDPTEVGAIISAEQAAELPVGTILSSWNPNNQAWGYYVRVSHGSRNRANTRRIIGDSNHSLNYADLMRVERHPERRQDHLAGFYSHDQMGCMPEGVAVAAHNGQTYTRIRTTGQRLRWRDQYGSNFRTADMSWRTVRITQFPDGTMPEGAQV